MNGYLCFYRGRSFEVRADTKYEAQEKAAKHFKASKSWEVTVGLAERGRVPVMHDGAELP